MAISCFNIFLLASGIHVPGSGDDQLVDRNCGLPFSIVLEETTPIVEVTGRTPPLMYLHCHQEDLVSR